MGTKRIGLLVCLALVPSWALAGDEATKVAAGGNEFAYDLYRELQGTSGNLFFSPSSIHQALTMTAMGAKGPTEREMLSVLHLPMPRAELERGMRELQPSTKPPRDPRKADTDVSGDARGVRGALVQEQVGESAQFETEVDKLVQRLRAAQGKKPAKPASDGNGLQTVNAIWPSNSLPLDPRYVDLLTHTFKAGVRPQDYARDPEGARSAINRAIAKQTNGTIKELLGPGTVDASTSMVLTNAIRFKGAWATPFGEAREGTWTNADGSAVPGVMLMKAKTEFNYAEVGGVKAIDLPYADGRTMTVLLPSEPGKLAEVEQLFMDGKLDSILGQMQKTKVGVTLPRFSTSSEYQLRDTLMGMPATTAAAGGAPSGMPTAFSPAADFNGISPNSGLRLSQVVHKAFIDVDEEGTTATAATAVMATRGLSFDPEFRATHPFLYVIRDPATTSILFVGRMANPK